MFVLSSVIVAILACFNASFGACSLITSHTELDDTFEWESIKSSKHLKYHSCYDGLECARLQVPLDWTVPENPNIVILAVARLPARVTPSDNSFAGSILLNPGGPSGSGIDFLRRSGRGIQEIVDSEEKYEIVSFDPRGTEYTVPWTECFTHDEARLMLQLHSQAVGSVNSSHAALNVRWAEAEGLGRLCGSTPLGLYPDGSNIRQYVSTSLVAHDMLAIVDRIAELRKEELQKTTSNTQQPIGANPTSVEKKPPLLNYWGFSYGTVLGNTFASMFPHRVGRMILDGVVDAPDYVNTDWVRNLQDNNQVWGIFFDWCFEAGPKCALYNPRYTHPLQMSLAVDEFIGKLKENPLPIIFNGGVYVFTFSDLARQMHLASYAPYQVWPQLAVGLAALMQGDVEAIATHFRDLNAIAPPSQRGRPAMKPFWYDFALLAPLSRQSAPHSHKQGYPQSYEAVWAILCGDGNDISSSTKEEYVEYVQRLSNQSRLFGPVWAEISLFCRHWPASLRPAQRNRFTGPFRSNLSDYDCRASPILFIGNTADPVTPVRNAFNMAKYHEGARVLVQDSPGHCSGPHIPSACTWNVVKAFFKNGTMPESGHVCPVDWEPWDWLD